MTKFYVKKITQFDLPIYIKGAGNIGKLINGYINKKRHVCKMSHSHEV